MPMELERWLAALVAFALAGVPFAWASVLLPAWADGLGYAAVTLCVAAAVAYHVAYRGPLDRWDAVDVRE
ncbi:hypothetical protein [Halobaculum sp. D14]|uniref:hypothetical protein n=1 Tax=Halobaculum sp. D14 TaxID=3421642 RepID=UPI003EBA583B